MFPFVLQHNNHHEAVAAFVVHTTPLFLATVEVFIAIVYANAIYLWIIKLV